MSLKIGIIAEEQNDIDVLYQLTCKLVKENSFSFSKFIGHGCGKLRHKCKAWAKVLICRGCSHLVVMHDLDEGNEASLREELESSISDLAFNGSLVLIPVHEVESWLLCDATAIRKVFSMTRQPRVPVRPERILKAKEYLRDLVWKMNKKRYVNTIHNEKIASEMQIEALQACKSFIPYPTFVEEMVR